MKKLIILGLSISIWSCGDKETPNDLELINYAPTPYQIPVPAGWSNPEIPADNPMTYEGIELGRRLFYDPILSVDSTIACASCHHIGGAFTDNAAVSIGVNNREGSRSAMSLVNLAFMTKGFFWDGRVKTLEEQALLPVEDHLEMAENWGIAEQKLRRHSSYPSYFRKAFGTTERTAITRELAVKAIAQFERSIVSQNSRYERYRQGKVTLTDDEEIGKIMFFNDVPNLPDAQCGHCHSGPLLSDNNYRNNGLQAAATLDDFKDNGLGGFNKNRFHNGLMRTPTLLNMGFSMPYMHNGSLKTIDDIVGHYASGGKYSPNLDPLIQQIKLNNIQRKQLVAFLGTLNDSSFVLNPAYKNPFK